MFLVVESRTHHVNFLDPGSRTPSLLGPNLILLALSGLPALTELVSVLNP